MTLLQKLKAAGCRIDGLSWDPRGNLIFVATNVTGPWSHEDKAKVMRALGRSVRLEGVPY
jgi:hypothetical protein